MQIDQDKAVLLNYTLKDVDGTVLESSVGADPLAYLHGHQNIIVGLESELQGKSQGDNLEVTVEPARAYGEHNKDMVQVVDRNLFEGMDVKPGIQFQAQTGQGVQVVTVVSADEDEVTIDGNHPMAGKTLVFEVEVLEVREASAEELEHGHVHGPGGHDH